MDTAHSGIRSIERGVISITDDGFVPEGMLYAEFVDESGTPTGYDVTLTDLLDPELIVDKSSRIWWSDNVTNVDSGTTAFATHLRKLGLDELIETHKEADDIPGLLEVLGISSMDEIQDEMVAKALYGRPNTPSNLSLLGSRYE